MARIGDTLLVTPVIHSLKSAFPDTMIDVLVHPKRMSVLENNPHINRLIGFNGFRYLQGLLFRRKIYDMVLIYKEEARLLKYGRAVGKYTVGFKQKNQQLNKLLDSVIQSPPTPLHAVDERLLLIKDIVISTVDRKLIYHINDVENQWANIFIEKHGLHGGIIKIGFHVAGFPTKAYRDWPAEHFISLGRFILKELNAEILLFGDKKDIKKAQHIQSALGDKTLIVAGKTNLRQTAALLSKCDVFVTTDTGPMHIAFALEVPTVAMFHCMHPGKYLGPTTKTEIHRIIQMEPPQVAECGRHLTIDTVDSSMVWDAIKDILKGRN